MALTRNFLKSLSLSSEQIESVIHAHGETVSGLKEEIARVQQTAAALPGIQKELDDARQELQLLQDDPWEARFHAVSTEFDAFRQTVTARETRQAKEQAYRKLLQEAGVSQRRQDAVLRVTDLDCLSWEDGAFTDPAGISAQIKEEWAEFIGTTKVYGADIPRPPVVPKKREDLGALPMREYIRRRNAGK